jgi:cytochrome c biogenesis protein CcmG/thiol:disulfide interchange protein DsbE
MKKYIPIGILLILLILIAIATKNLATSKNEGEPASASLDENIKNDKDKYEDVIFTKTDIELPDFILPLLFENNKFLTKKDLIGKYTIINFFASWCSTCLAEHEILLRLQSEAVGDLYGIAWRDIDDNVLKYLKKNGNPYSKVATDGKALFTKIANIDAVPETWIINPKGHLVLRLKGNLQDFSIDEIKRYIKLN